MMRLTQKLPRPQNGCMCGRFSLSATSEELARTLGSPQLAGFRIEARFNIAPGQHIIVLRPEKGERTPIWARWGLVPSWARDPDAGPKPINARAEGLATKPTFRGAFRRGRCIIPATGFFEWKGVGKRRQPHYIHPKEGGIFVFAGLVDTWKGPEGDLTTCTVITTTPNELMATLHDRMPVILEPDDISRWLDPMEADPGSLLRPFPSDRMEAYPVGAEIGRVSQEGAWLIDKAPAGLFEVE